MSSTYSPSLRIELIGAGEQSGTWNTTTNSNLGTLIEQSIAGVTSISMVDANYALTAYNGVSDQSRQAVIVVSGTNSAIRDVIAPLVTKTYLIKNNTSGGFAINIRAATGASVSIPNGITSIVYCDGTNFNLAITSEVVGVLPVIKGGTGVTTSTGTGSVVLNTSPALVTPQLGTPASGTLSNCTLPQLSASSGSILVSTIQSGVGAVSRTVASKLNDFINVKDFGATGNGSTDDTVAIQNALTAAGINGSVYFPVGNYFVSSTITGLGNQTLRGAGANSTIITRTGNYGDTFVFGGATTACGHVRIYDMWMAHGNGNYVPGVNSLPNLATSGAHVRLWGSQEPILSNVWLWRLPYQLVMEGGSLAVIEKCHFYGIWDNLYPACQEGVAQVLLRSSPLGIVTSTKIRDSFFTGNCSLARNVTFTPSTGSVVKSITDPVGSQYGVKIDCSEDFDMTGCYLSAHTQNSVLVDNISTDPAFELRFSNNFFDAVKQYSIQISPISSQSSYINITGNTFNGEGTGIGGISINQSAGAWVCHSTTISNNNFLAHIGTPILASGLYFGNITGNTFTSYNILNVTPSDPSWCSALYITSPSANITANGNEVGYGTYCFLGVSIAGGLTGIQQYGNNYLSTTNGSILDFGKLVMPVDGRLYGTALHNNANAITGTTNQYIASGTYTPALTVLSNITSSTIAQCQYIRVGNVVTVSGQLLITPTATATISNFLLALPIASTIANTSNLGGSGTFDTNAIVNAVSIVGNIGNNEAYFQFISSGTTSTPLAFSFTYLIL